MLPIQPVDGGYWQAMLVILLAFASVAFLGTGCLIPLLADGRLAHPKIVFPITIGLFLFSLLLALFVLIGVPHTPFPPSPPGVGR